APVAAAILLPALLVRLKRERPRVVVKMHFGNLGQLLPALEAQQLDLCFGDPRIVPPTDRVERVQVAQVYGALCCRKGHPAIRRREIDAKVMREFGVGSFTITPELLAPVARSFGFASAGSFPMTLQCDDVKLLAQIAASTDLLVILPEVPGTPPEGLHLLPWAHSRTQSANMHAMWLAGRTLSPPATFAIEAAREIGAVPAP
ncbi:MAG: LysR substrate-binding domain-containing protein, partial [Ramlibacter sp.]